MLALAPFRSKAAGLPDLLNYAALVDEGVVLGKDGSLISSSVVTTQHPPPRQNATT